MSAHPALLALFCPLKWWAFQRLTGATTTFAMAKKLQVGYKWSLRPDSVVTTNIDSADHWSFFPCEAYERFWAGALERLSDIVYWRFLLSSKVIVPKLLNSSGEETPLLSSSLLAWYMWSLSDTDALSLMRGQCLLCIPCVSYDTPNNTVSLQPTILQCSTPCPMSSGCLHSGQLFGSSGKNGS